MKSNSFVRVRLLKSKGRVWKTTLTNYETGRRLEYRIRDLFLKNGYFVIRAAQSKPIDLVCIRDGKSVLVECKVGRSWLGPSRKEELRSISERAGAPIVVARRKSRRLELTYLDDGQPFDSVKLKLG